MERQDNQVYKKLIGMGAALICCLLLLPTLRILPTGAQQPMSSSSTSRGSDLEPRIDVFFQSLKRLNSVLAFDELLRGSLLGSSGAIEQRNKLQSDTDEMRTEFGEILEWEPYETKTIGRDIISIRYILKYERYPVIWTFTFYRKPSSTPTSLSASNTWALIGLHCDTDLR